MFSPDSRILYFTTTLNPSVHAYSIANAALWPSQQPHPSPPNVIAVSHDGNVLLSASSTPPTVYIQDRPWQGSAPLSFQPTDANTPVSCAAFQSFGNSVAFRGSVDSTQLPYTKFLLGFQDGTMAMYQLFFRSPMKRDKDTLRWDHTHNMRPFPVRIGAIKKLHKPSMGGITAAEFIPGYKARVVSIGHDGRCRLVDFQLGSKILRT